MSIAVQFPERAIPRLQDALARMPDAWWARADAAEWRVLLGRTLQLAGRPAEARAALDAALAETDRQYAAPLARVRAARASAAQ